MLLLLQQQNQLQQDTSKPSFPKWDGKDISKPIFLERMRTFKLHRYFSTVTNWSAADYAHREHSLHIRKSMFECLPQTSLYRYLNDPTFVTDGFAMLDHLTQLRNAEVFKRLCQNEDDDPIGALGHVVAFVDHVPKRMRLEMIQTIVKLSAGQLRRLRPNQKTSGATQKRIRRQI